MLLKIDIDTTQYPNDRKTIFQTSFEAKKTVSHILIFQTVIVLALVFVRLALKPQSPFLARIDQWDRSQARAAMSEERKLAKLDLRELKNYSNTPLEYLHEIKTPH